MEKFLEYAAKLNGAINEVVNNEDSDWYIGQDELLEGDNLTEFIHALATVMPCHVYNQLTGDDADQLGFNHVANRLCFQYCNHSDSEITKADKA